MLRGIIEEYHDIIDNKSDPRVNNWFLMSSPFPTLLACLSYVYFSKVLGPKLMEKRKPMDLQTVLIIYNFIQVLISAWILKEGLLSGWLFHYSFICQPIDYSNNPMALRMAGTCWWYFMSKFTEFLDTVFFVLRKKNKQISTLHVIHHSVMPALCWIGVKFVPGGHGSFFGILNTFVHVIMYSYYLVAALGPRFQKYLSWKKYLTILQMVQFVLVILHSFQLLFIECDYPKSIVYLAGLMAIMFYFLFADFYRETYKKKQDVEGKNGEIRRKQDSQHNGSICFPQAVTRSVESTHTNLVNKKTD